MRPAAIDDLVAVEGSADHVLEPVVPVTVIGPADGGEPLVERELDPVCGELLGYRGELVGLGVQDQPVEVEDERADDHPCTLERRVVNGRRDLGHMVKISTK